MSNLDMGAVVKFYNYYHEKRKSHPTLYYSSKQVTVVLPADLLDWSNAAAGHSGFGSGARPVGIRKSVADGKAAIDEIFATPDTLATFIKTSECDGPAHVEEVKKRHAVIAPKIDPKTADVFWKRYTRDTMQNLVAKFGRATVEQSYKALTISEFEARFGIAA